MTPLLFFLILGGAQAEQQMQRQMQQLEQLGRALEQQRQQFDRVLGELEKMSQANRGETRAVAICSVELRPVNGADARKVPPNPAAVVPLNLFSTVSQPASACLPAEVRVT